MEQSYVIRNDRVIGKTVPNINYNYSTCPIGSIFAFSSERIPLGFFICDGASYKVAEYPDLYAVIGNVYGGDSTNFNVPDYRETVLVGVGENTTDTIASHDVYELGEFKDDQLQGHEHSTYKNYEGGATGGAGSATNYGGVVHTLDIASDGTNGEPRKGTTTHGKQKGVTYIIKAFHTNEGVDSNEVTDQIIEYVEGEIDALISDTTTSETSTWSSSKIASSIIGTKTQYRGSQSIDISTSSKLTFIYSSMYASQAGCYMLLSNYNTTPLLIELGKFPQSSFNVTATNKSFGVDTITVTTASDEYSWCILQF